MKLMLSLLIDLVLAITVAELLWLMLSRHRIAKLPLLANLGAGLGLLLALRLVIADAALPWIALALAGAGVAHLLDLRARWRAAA